MLQDGERIQEELAAGRQLSSGLLVANGIYCLDGHMHDLAQQKETERQEKERAKQRKDCCELLKHIRAINVLHAKKGKHSTCTMQKRPSYFCNTKRMKMTMPCLPK